MRGVQEGARTLRASGRSSWMLLAVGACTLAGPPSSAPREAPGLPPDPVVETGPISAGREAEAARIYAQARDAFEAGRHTEAVRLAERIVSDFPRAPVSGRALLLSAQAAAAAGDPLRADVAAERYVALLPDGDPRVGTVRLLQARAVDSPSARADRLLLIPATAPREVYAQGVDLARGAAAQLEAEAIEDALRNAPEGAPLLWVFEVRAGVVALETGDAAAATRYAERALALGATGPDSVVAEGLLEGLLPGGRSGTANVAIGTVLPLTGPPALVDFARRIAEGVEVAASTVLGERARVDVEVLDDQADPSRAASLVRQLERDGLQGAVGFLEDAALEAAGQARTRGVPLVSPTARTAFLAGEASYSLEGPDPLAAATMARYAADQGYVRVAIIHSQAPASTEEADAFEATIRSLGIPVVGRYAYPAGATFFQDQIRGAQRQLRDAEIAALRLGEDDTLHVEMLEPVALFMPIPPEDVEFVAPQVVHFGLDTLAINVLGTSGWTDSQVLAGVNTRHTTGVVATAPLGGGPESPGQRRFREAYERHFQRSLVSPVPAAGYDAALLLLEALRGDPTTPREARRAFERLRDVEGANGIYSVINGRVVRRTQVVYIDNGTLVPIL